MMHPKKHRKLGPKTGKFYLSESFWTIGGDTKESSIVLAGAELVNPDSFKGDTLYVVQVVAVVRKRAGYDVE